MPLPNRMAVYLTGFIALVAGLLPLVGNLDWTSTAGIIAGLAAIAFVVREWLVNWGKWEERKDLEPLIEEQLGTGPPPVASGLSDVAEASKPGKRP